MMMPLKVMEKLTRVLICGETLLIFLHFKFQVLVDVQMEMSYGLDMAGGEETLALILSRSALLSLPNLP